jgi:NTE family protein
MIAFVLSGGGVRGALQAGALRALIERGIRPDLIVGTSVGALNGVTLAADPTPGGARRMAEGWPQIRRSDIFPGNRLTVAWRILTGQGSLHGQTNFNRFILATLPPNVRRFKDLRIPCVVTATVLSTGQLRLFGLDPHERLVDALLASTAIPPFFAPYHHGGDWLVDGAVVANLPLAQAIERGARTIYALEIIDEATTVSGRSLLQTLSISLSAMLSRQHEQERRIIQLGRQRGVVVHYITLTGGQHLAYNDFSKSAALVESGQRATLAYLDSLPAPQPPPHRRLAQALRGMVRTLGTRRTLTAPPPA